MFDESLSGQPLVLQRDSSLKIEMGLIVEVLTYHHQVSVKMALDKAQR